MMLAILALFTSASPIRTPVWQQQPAFKFCDTIPTPDRDGSGAVFLVAPGTDGRVAWTDAVRNGANIYLRDHQGGLHIVGRTGSGPGEHIRAGTLNWRRDTLWTSDIAQLRIQSFSEIGKFISARRYSIFGSWFMGEQNALVNWIPVYPPGAPKISMAEVTYALITVRPPGDHPDTLFRHPFVGWKQRDVSPEQWTLVASSIDGTYWCAIGEALTSGVRLSCVDAMGRPYLMGIRRYSARPLTDAVWTSEASRYVRSNGAGVIPIMTDARRAPALPYAFDLMVNTDGEVWALRSFPTEPRLTWDRIGRDGKPRPSITVSNRLQMRALDGDWFYAADTDDDGLQALIKCSITGSRQ